MEIYLLEFQSLSSLWQDLHLDPSISGSWFLGTEGFNQSNLWLFVYFACYSISPPTLFFPSHFIKHFTLLYFLFSHFMVFFFCISVFFLSFFPLFYFSLLPYFNFLILKFFLLFLFSFSFSHFFFFSWLHPWHVKILGITFSLFFFLFGWGDEGEPLSWSSSPHSNAHLLQNCSHRHTQN